MVTAGRKAFPIGLSNFYKLRHDDYCYVDKTFLVQRLLDEKVNAVLFTRPRRFGKSLALSMLRSFFDCNAKEKNAPLFEGLAVAQSERCMAEQGKYPVIFLNFKDVNANTQEGVEMILRRKLQDALLPYGYISQSLRLDQDEKDRFAKLRKLDVPLEEISSSFNFVCYALAKHHGQPVVLLVDEYDTPLQAAYLSGFYQPICKIMRNFFSTALKDNDYLRLGVITGVLRIAKESLFSGLNNLEVDTILSRGYADCFGFTQAEVDILADYYGAGDKKGEIKEWYDGYRFGELDIYNPWSVLGYFKNNCEPKAYWLDTSSNDITRAFLKRLVKSPDNPVVQLSQGGVVTAKVDAAVSYAQLERQASGGSEANDRLYSLMAITGYLKPVECIRGDRYNLKIPNREIRTIYADEILSHLEDGLHIGDLNALGDAIVQGQVQRFTELLNKYMSASLSYYDSAEAFYHGWVMGLLLILGDEYTCLSNREAGEGRSDIMLVPRPGRTYPGMVFELKRSKTVKQLPEMAAEALRQIEDKNYISGFPPHVSKVVGYGMAFCRKRCELVQRANFFPPPC